MDDQSTSTSINPDDVTIKTIMSPATGGATLLNINYDGLHDIFHYLEILDVARMAATCEKLSIFADAVIFPKMAKKIQINIVCGLTQPGVNIAQLVQHFDLFGEHVKNLTFRGVRYCFTEQLQNCKTIIALCPNLQKLRIENFVVKREDHDVLKDITAKIKHLELENFQGITDECSDSLMCLPNLEKFTLTGNNDTITDDFLKHFRNLSSLSIEAFTALDLEKVFDLTGHSLLHLRLMYPSRTADYRSLKKLIIDKLPKLERLEIMDSYRDSTRLKHSITDLPNLKSLELWCNYFEIANPILQEISKNTNIVNLTILSSYFVFIDEIYAPSLVFNELQNYEWCRNTCNKIGIHKTEHNMLKAMIKADMPKIRTFGLTCEWLTLDERHTTALLALLKSKESLRVLKVNAKFEEPFKFVEQVMDILKEKTAPTTRPAFKLEMPEFSMGPQEVRRLRET